MTELGVPACPESPFVPNFQSFINRSLRKRALMNEKKAGR